MISALTLLDIAEDKCEAINVEIEEEIQNLDQTSVLYFHET